MNIADIDRGLLPLVEKPVRYAGAFSRSTAEGPANAPVKGVFIVPSLLEDAVADTALRACLVAANSRDGSWAEPAFAPGADIARLLAKAGAPWFTAWTRRPIGEASYIVFLLPSPLAATSVLAILEAAGVARRSEQRRPGDPLVAALLAGGFAPGPLERFFDLFLLGEGPAPVDAWLDLLQGFADPAAERESVLDRAAALDGLYVPSRARTRGEPAQAVTSMGGPASANAGLASFTPPIGPSDGEYRVETSFGPPPRSRLHAWSPRGPWRHRAHGAILGEAAHLMLQPGVRRLRIGAREDDRHPAARAMAEELMRRLLGVDIELAFESQRPRVYEPALSPALARMRHGAAICPESGDERLRRVLGLRATNEELIDGAVRAGYDGLQSLRLLFTLGLPGEGEEFEAIVPLVEQVQRANRNPKSRWRLMVEVAPFVPRPWTPFQWEPFTDAEQYRDRARRVSEGLGRLKLRPRIRKPEAFLVEAVLTRGDAALADLIERAYALGARADHEPEQFRFEKWQQAAADLGVDLPAAASGLDPSVDPAWCRISFGAAADELRAERRRALSAELPEAVEPPAAPAIDLPVEEPGDAAPWNRYGRRLKPRGPRSGAHEEGTRFRLRYRKTGAARFLSHLDLVHLLHVAFLRLGVPPALEKGRQKISFGPPLPVGMAGEDEYLDVELSRPGRPDLFTAFKTPMPRGVEIREARVIRGEPPSLDSILNAAVYRVVLTHTVLSETEWNGREAALRERIAADTREFLAQREVLYRGSRGEADWNLKDEVFALDALGEDDPPGIRAGVWLRMGGRIRPAELLARFIGAPIIDPRLFDVTREKLLVRRGDQEWTPMEALELTRTASPGAPSEPSSVGGIL